MATFNGTGVCGTNGSPFQQNNQPVQCSPTNGIATCPSGYSCQFSSSGNGLYYCCTGNTFSAYCGNGNPFLQSGQPQQCFPGLASTCPLNYICELSASLNAYYCCAGGGK
jgi:Lustrin, cysteine-rich repeated domain